MLVCGLTGSVGTTPLAKIDFPAFFLAVWP
jgi:hypothetical protein